MTDAATLFALYQDRLRRYLGRACGETELARDLTQEVFLRITRVAIPVASENQLGGWLFRIARNVVLDHHRQRSRRPEKALDPGCRSQSNPSRPPATARGPRGVAQPIGRCQMKALVGSVIITLVFAAGARAQTDGVERLSIMVQGATISSHRPTVTRTRRSFEARSDRVHPSRFRASPLVEKLEDGTERSQPLSRRGLYHRPIPFYFDSISQGAMALDIFGEVTAATGDRTSDVKIKPRSRLKISLVEAFVPRVTMDVRRFECGQRVILETRSKY